MFQKKTLLILLLSCIIFTTIVSTETPSEVEHTEEDKKYMKALEENDFDTALKMDQEMLSKEEQEDSDNQFEDFIKDRKTNWTQEALLKALYKFYANTSAKKVEAFGKQFQEDPKKVKQEELDTLLNAFNIKFWLDSIFVEGIENEEVLIKFKHSEFNKF